MVAYQTYNGQELLALLQSGDEQAFKEIYHRYWKHIFGIACLRLQRREIAEDIVQDIFTSLWQKRQELEINNLEAWLATAVKFKIISLINRRLQKEILSEDLPETAISDTTIDFRLFQQQLEKEMNHLPEKPRLVFKLSREAGYSNREIATELNISEKTVEAHITTARRKLSISLRNFLQSFLSLI